jgi:hypothetical protein
LPRALENPVLGWLLGPAAPRPGLVRLAVRLAVSVRSGLRAPSLASDQRKRMPSVALTPGDHEVAVTVDGSPFTTYAWADEGFFLAKPVLNPIHTGKGTPVTRGFPIAPRAGERVDHPHHIGLWFNFGNVNGLDFWNNSDDIAEDARGKYGTIRHRSIDHCEGGEGTGTLRTTSEWLTPSGEALLRETTTYTFGAEANASSTRSIERQTELEALTDVLFKDDKEGTMGIRVARELEHPSEDEAVFTDANGNETPVTKMDNTGVVGLYVTSEGVTGDDVWGTRGDWCSLGGSIEGEDVALTVYDHPSNPGYPTYWHARGYGLFSANNLGQEALSDGKDVLNLTLKPGESATFRHRITVDSSALDAPALNERWEAFAASSSSSPKL